MWYVCVQYVRVSSLDSACSVHSVCVYCFDVCAVYVVCVVCVCGLFDLV